MAASTNITLAACGVPNKDQSSIVYAIAGSFGTIAILMTILRIVDRVWINRISLGLDDIFILCATVRAPRYCLKQDSVLANYYTRLLPYQSIIFALLVSQDNCITFHRTD